MRLAQVLWLMTAAAVVLGFMTNDGNVSRFLWVCAVPIGLLALLVSPAVGKRPR